MITLYGISVLYKDKGKEMDIRKILTDASDEKSTVEDLLSITILPITLFKTKQDTIVVINELKNLIIADYIIDDKLIDSNIAYLMKRAGFDYPAVSDKITSYYYTTEEEKKIDSNMLMTHFTNSLYYIHKKIYSETNDNSIPLRKIKNAMNFFDSMLTPNAEDYVKVGLETISRYNGTKNKVAQYKEMKTTVLKNINEKKQTNKNIINATAQNATAQNATAQIPVKIEKPNHNENTRQIIGEAIGQYIIENNGIYDEKGQDEIYWFYHEQFDVEYPEISKKDTQVKDYCINVIKNIEQLVGINKFDEDQTFDIKQFVETIVKHTIDNDKSNKNNFDNNRNKIGMDLVGKIRSLNNIIKNKNGIFLTNKEIGDIIQDSLNKKAKKLKDTNKTQPINDKAEDKKDNKKENILEKTLKLVGLKK
jgi:hypothetical protein